MKGESEVKRVKFLFFFSGTVTKVLLVVSLDR